MSPEDVIPIQKQNEIIRKAVLSRTVELKLLELFSEGKLFGTVHTCVGQEFSGAVISEFLKEGDVVFSNHRCHGHFLSVTDDARGLISEIMGKGTGVCGGKGGSQHLYKKGFASNGVQGSIMPVSAGRAMAKKILNDAKISVVFIGDGTLGEGAVYETFNIVAKWGLPLLIVLEDNGYAQSTSQTETLAGGMAARGEAFGIRFFEADTWNWKKFYGVAGEATSYVRNERRPALLRVQTYRLKAHSKGDDNRPKEEIQEYEKKDPLNQLASSQDQNFMAIKTQVVEKVNEAVKFAEDSAFPTPPPLKSSSTAINWRSRESFEKKRVGARINELFKAAMGADPKIFFIGEDVKSPYGGAFKISDNLSNLFPDRVFNTPISEGAIVGLGAGMAMEGFKPFVEIMFGDFTSLAFDQILNGVSKFEDMFNGQVRLDLVIRTPMGGRRGYGPTHSQTLDRHFLGIPGLRVVALHGMVDPKGTFDVLFKGGLGPTLLIENKLLYSQFLQTELPPGYKGLCSDETFSTFFLEPQAELIDVTLIGYGGMASILVDSTERLFEKHDLIAQVLIPSQIYPFQIDKWLDVIRKSRAVVIVEEGQGFAGFASEIIAQIGELEPSLLSRCRRIIPTAQCIPASRVLEEAMLPGVDHVVNEVNKLLST